MTYCWLPILRELQRELVLLTTWWTSTTLHTRDTLVAGVTCEIIVYPFCSPPPFLHNLFLQ
jgi:hypothetical protein